MDIPLFPRMKLLSIEDRAFMHDRIWKFQPEISELTFTNLFMWRHHYKFQWTYLNDTIFLFSGDTPSEMFVMQPIGPRPFKKDMQIIIGWLHDTYSKARFERLDTETAKEFSDSPEFIISPSREHFDYLYSTPNLSTLSGRHYHAKRNHLTYFRNNYSYTYTELTPDLINPCLDFAKHWCKMHHHEDESLCEEFTANNEALTNYETLNFKGGVITINGTIEAFTIGEMLNTTTAVIHIEKANSEIRGSYVAINQLFCEYAWKNTAFINREQDLGNDGLRAAKLSYHPQRMVEKFSISSIK